MARAVRQYIDGEWCGSESERYFEVANPSNGNVLALVPDSNQFDSRRAIDAAAGAFPAWSRLTAQARADVLAGVSSLMIDRQDELARLLAQEEGKPITEARGEVRYAAGFLTFYAEEGKRTYGQVIPAHIAGKRLMTVKQPVGVVGIISIWNFPLAGITRPVAAALAAGCTVVVKPPEQTPLSAIAVAELCEEVGLPHGVLNVVTTRSPDAIGKEFVDNNTIRKISFTGSVTVGQRLMQGAANHIQRVSLELGGHSPLIVFDDADIQAAAEGAATSKFRNAGQTCVAVNRIYLHDRIADDFQRHFVDLTSKLRVGDPLDESTHVGPLIDEAAGDKVERHVADALSKGAAILCGGQRLEVNGFEKGRFFIPTVLGDVTHDMQIMQEETFGPVAPLVRFSTEDQVVAWANEPPYGLAAFAYTRDLARTYRMIEQLEFGIIGINDALPGAPHVPFGGMKQSGLGKEGGTLGLEEFLETKLISLGI